MVALFEADYFFIPILNFWAEICDRRQDLPAFLLRVDSDLIHLSIQFDGHNPKPRRGRESSYASEVVDCIESFFNLVCFKLILHYLIVFGLYLRLIDQLSSDRPIYFLEILAKY